PAKSRGGRRFWSTTQVSRGRGRPISSCWSGRAANWSASAISAMRVTRLRARKWSTCLQAQPDKRSLSMRRFVESGLVSLDGVFGHPHICANENLGREVKSLCAQTAFGCRCHAQEVTMRKLIVSTLVTLDGVVQDPVASAKPRKGAGLARTSLKTPRRSRTRL